MIGRDVSCEITVDDGIVSRHHARFLVDDKGLFLVDLNSRNGTFVQDAVISEARLLRHGDKIRIGSFECTVQFEQISAADASPDAEVVEPGAPVDNPDQSDPSDEQDDPATLGSIVVLPRYENLPPAWVYDEEGGTQVLRESDREKLDQELEKSYQDLTLFESTIDAPTLVVATGPAAGTPYKLQRSSTDNYWTIGRGSEELSVSIVVDDASVSVLHAKLSDNNGRWKIADQMSTNKTYVNGEQFNSAFLSSRDVIRLGSVSFLFLLPFQATKEPEQKESNGGFVSRIRQFFKS
ncbi:MAG: hypothetical protein Hals2KO_15420 [Halioglobus sp.]